MKNKTIDVMIRQMLNRQKPIICSRSSHQAFIDGKQDYICVRVNGVYYHYSPRSKTQKDKIRYYSNMLYNEELK